MARAHRARCRWRRSAPRAGLGAVVISGRAFPIAQAVVVEQFNPLEPFETLIKVPPRHDQPHGAAVFHRERRPSTSSATSDSSASATSSGSDVLWPRSLRATNERNRHAPSGRARSRSVASGTPAKRTASFDQRVTQCRSTVCATRGRACSSSSDSTYGCPAAPRISMLQGESSARGARSPIVGHLPAATSCCPGGSETVMRA